MAEEQVKESAAKKAPIEAEDTFSHDELIERSVSQIGHPQHVVVGALADLKSNKDITVERAKKAVDEFLKRPVKVEEN